MLLAILKALVPVKYLNYQLPMVKVPSSGQLIISQAATAYAIISITIEGKLIQNIEH